MWTLKENEIKHKVGKMNFRYEYVRACGSVCASSSYRWQKSVGNSDRNEIFVRQSINLKNFLICFK